MITLTVRINNQLEVARNRRPIVARIGAAVFNDTVCRKVDAAVGEAIHNKLASGLRSKGVEASIEQTSALVFRIIVRNASSLAKQKRPFIARLATLIGLQGRIETAVDTEILKQLKSQVSQSLNREGVQGHVSGAVI